MKLADSAGAVRLTLAFVAAYGGNLVLHEVAHAITARALGLHATLFAYFVNIDYPEGDAGDRLLCAAAGPIFSLLLGTAAWMLYRGRRNQPSAPLLLYAWTLGISIFLGNLFSTAFAGGDFATVASLLNLSFGARLAIMLAGGLSLAGFLYRAGPEFVRWTDSACTPARRVVQAIVWPVTLGTALIILAFQPMPPSFAVSWAAGSVFWLFAAPGAWAAAKSPGPAVQATFAPWPIDLAAALAVLALVRALSRGIRFGPG